MKKLYSLLIALLIFSLTYAQEQRTFAGPLGIYIKAGKEFARDFSWEIDGKTTDGKWQKLCLLNFPHSEVEFRNKVMEAATMLPLLKMPSDKEIHSAWANASRNNTIDSLYLDAANPLYYYALGLGSVLRIIPKDKALELRVMKVKGRTLISEESLPPITLPGPVKTKFKTLSAKAVPGEIHLEFEIADLDRMQDCKVFRGHLLRKDFKEIKPLKMITMRNNKIFMDISDDSPQQNVAYSYFLVPYDLMGNKGLSSDTVNINNSLENSLQTLLTYFNAISLDKENAIKISWRLKSTESLISVDLYKSSFYDTGYSKIASVSPQDTFFIDNRVEPVKGYYYRAIFNGFYEQSFPSSRIPAMLHASKPNNFPPDGIQAVLKGDKVYLTWNSSGKETRGYYVYRAENYDGEMKQLGSLVSNDNKNLSFVDELKPSEKHRIYSYAIAGENSSYAISPLSERSAVQVPASIMDLPTGLRTRYENGQVLLTWDNLFDYSNNIKGFNVYRRCEDPSGKVLEDWKLLNKTPTGFNLNYYRDSLVNPGTNYHYKISSLGLDTTVKSSFSAEAGCIIPANLPDPPSNIKLISSGGKVNLMWDMPMDDQVAYVRIIRTGSDKSMQEFKTSNPETSEFLDASPIKDITYFYQFLCVSKRGDQGKASIPVGVKLE